MNEQPIKHNIGHNSSFKWTINFHVAKKQIMKLFCPVIRKLTLDFHLPHPLLNKPQTLYFEFWHYTFIMQTYFLLPSYFVLLHNVLMHKASIANIYEILVRTLEEISALPSAIRGNADIQVVIIRSKFHKSPFITFWFIRLIGRHTNAQIQGQHNILQNTLICWWS